MKEEWPSLGPPPAPVVANEPKIIADSPEPVDTETLDNIEDNNENINTSNNKHIYKTSFYLRLRLRRS